MLFNLLCFISYSQFTDTRFIFLNTNFAKSFPWLKTNTGSFIIWKIKLKLFILWFKTLLVLTYLLCHIFHKNPNKTHHFICIFPKLFLWSFSACLLPESFTFSRNVLPLPSASLNSFFPSRKRTFYPFIHIYNISLIFPTQSDFSWTWMWTLCCLLCMILIYTVVFFFFFPRDCGP